MPEMSVDEKHQIIAVLNQHHGTHLSLKVCEMAAGYGFTSWTALQQEAAAALAETPDLEPVDR